MKKPCLSRPANGPIANIDDGPSGGLIDHDQANPLTAEERAEGVQFKMTADIFGRHVFEPSRLPDGRAVDQRVDAVEVGMDTIDHVVCRRLIGQIRADRQCRMPAGFEAPDELLGRGERMVGVDGHTVTASCQRFGDHPAHAATRARDQRHTVPCFAYHRSSFSSSDG